MNSKDELYSDAILALAKAVNQLITVSHTMLKIMRIKEKGKKCIED